MAYRDTTYRGVTRQFRNGRRSRPWRGYVYWEGRRFYIGHFATQAKAEQAEATERHRRQQELLNERTDLHIRQPSLFSK